MKYTFTYLLLIFLPFLSLIFLTRNGYLDSFEFVVGLFSYVLLYRPVIDFLRLKSKGILNSSDWGMKYFIDYCTNRYFVHLFTSR